MWFHSYRSSLRHILWKIEQRIPFMVLADLNEIIGTGIGKEIYPFFWIPGIRSKVLNKIVVYDIRSVLLQMVVVYISWIIRSLVKRPPVPIEFVS